MKKKLAIFLGCAAVCLAVKVISVIAAAVIGVQSFVVTLVLMCAATVFIASKTRRVLTFPLAVLTVDVISDGITVFRIYRKYVYFHNNGFSYVDYITGLAADFGFDISEYTDLIIDLLNRFGTFALLILILVLLICALINFGFLTGVSAISCAIFGHTGNKKNTDDNIN